MIEYQDEGEELRGELTEVLNRVSAENASSTPDYILADYMISCLNAFDAAVQARAIWRGDKR